MANCILCGAELVDGKCPNSEAHLKKMCLNCMFYDDGICKNQENMEIVRAKILESIKVPGSYEIEELKVRPVKLTNPTNKCPRYSAELERISKEIVSLLGE